MGQGLASLVFQPPQPATYRPDPRLIALRTKRLARIPAFCIRREGAQFWILFSHGNAEDLGLILWYFRELSAELDVNVFLYDYTGYGQSTGGEPREANVYADIEAAFKYMREEMQVPWQHIILYGRSIGTAPSVYLATQTPVRALILQSPMTSIYRIPFDFRFTLPGDVFCNIDKIGKVRCPVFIIHGTRDEIVPCGHGQELYEKCLMEGRNVDAYFVDGADHNNLEVQAGPAFYMQLSFFMQKLEQEPLSHELQEMAETVGAGAPGLEAEAES